MHAAKGFMWAVLLFFLGVCVYFIYQAVAADPGLMVGTAVGEPEDGKMECQVAISMMMAANDEVPFTDDGREDWEKWTNDHFKLMGENGDAPEFRRVGAESNMIDNNDLPTMEFVISAPINIDEEYTLTYHPVLSETEKWKYVFTPEDRGFRRVRFERVSK